MKVRYFDHWHPLSTLSNVIPKVSDSTVSDSTRRKSSIPLLMAFSSLPNANGLRSCNPLLIPENSSTGWNSGTGRSLAVLIAARRIGPLWHLS